MFRKLLAVAPLLLATPVAAAPKFFERDAGCGSVDAVTETVYQTQTVFVSSAASPTEALNSGTVGAGKEHYSPVDGYNSTGASSAAGPLSTGTQNPGTDTPGDVDHSRTYESSLYFTNWGIYGANFQPQQIPASKVTRILYAFADIASDGEVKSSDTYADLEKHYPTDSWNDQGKNAYGCIKQIFLLKKQNRNMKVLLSIGGWTYSPKFAPVAATEAGRQKFAQSAVKLVADWGFDGIDIDWEYPANANEAQDFIKLLQACRQELDSYAQKNAPGYHFLITVASPAGPTNYNNMDMKGMDPYVDAWNLMAYDYAGSWDSTSGHQANIYTNTENEAATKFSTEQAVKDYLAKGIEGSKIMMGLPLYGRSFESTNGIGQTYNGVGAGTIQSGVWLYKDLPKSGAQEVYDNVAKASYSYDQGSKELISYDNVKSAVEKTSYMSSRGLGGAVFWEASGDRSDEQSLVGTVAKQLGKLGSEQNLLSYPASQYDNIRAGMPDA